MIRALLLAGILGFLLGVAATFGFFQVSSPRRAFPPTESMGESPQTEEFAQPEAPAPSAAAGSTVASPSRAPAGPPATREELDEDD